MDNRAPGIQTPRSNSINMQSFNLSGESARHPQQAREVAQCEVVRAAQAPVAAVNSAAPVVPVAVNIAELAAPVVCTAAECNVVAAQIAEVCSAAAAQVVPAVQAARKRADAIAPAAAAELVVALEFVFALDQCEPAEHLPAVVQSEDGIVESCRSADLEIVLVSDSPAIAARVGVPAALQSHDCF